MLSTIAPPMIPSFSHEVGVTAASSQPSVRQPSAVNASAAPWAESEPAGAFHATANSGTTNGASHQRAPGTMTASATAASSGVATRARYVKKSAVPGAIAIAAITSAIEPAGTSAQLRPATLSALQVLG